MWLAYWPWAYLATVAPAAWMDWRWRQAPAALCLLWGVGAVLLAVWTGRTGDPRPGIRLLLGAGSLGWLWRRGHMGAADVLLGLPLLALQPATWMGAALLSLGWLRRPDRHQVPVVTLLWLSLLALTLGRLLFPGFDGGEVV